MWSGPRPRHSRPPSAPWQRSLFVDPAYEEEPLEEIFDEFMTERAGKTPSEKTRKRYRSHMRLFCAWLDRTGRARTMAVISYPTLRDFKHWLAERPSLNPRRDYDRPEQGMAVATLEGYMRDLHTFCSYLADRGWLARSPFSFKNPERLMPATPSKAKPPHRIARPETVDRLVAAIRAVEGPAALRDDALTETFWSATLRERDVSHLRLDQLDRKRGLLLDVWEHKDSEDRHVSLDDRALAALELYLAEGRPALIAAGERRGASDPGWLFISEHLGKCNNAHLAGRLTESGIYQVVRRRWLRAGGDGSLGPHAMRHGVGTMLGEAGAGRYLIMAKLGHRQAKSSDCYVHPSADALRRVVDPLIAASRATPPARRSALRTLPEKATPEPRSEAA